MHASAVPPPDCDGDCRPPAAALPRLYPRQQVTTGWRILVPRSSARIRLAGQSPRIAGPCQALFLAPRDELEIEPLGERFEVDSLALPTGWLDHLLAEASPAATPARGFPAPWAPLAAEAYLRLRLLQRPGIDGIDAWAQDTIAAALHYWRRQRAPAAMPSPRDQATAHCPLAQALALHIDAHWRGALRLETLAAEFGLSRFHLLRRFAAVHRLTPHRYQLQLRLRRSLALIERGDRRIVDIALQVGFCSHAHYAAAFRRCFGHSPAEFAGLRRPRRAAMTSRD